MTLYSHGFYMHNISVYQTRGNSKRKLKAVLMLPKWKENQRTQNACSLGHCCRLLALSRHLIVPHSHCQSDGSACCVWKLARKCNTSKQKYVLWDSRTRKSPLPPSGNKVDLKTSISISNDKIVYLGKQPKEKQEEALPQAGVPSAKTWILLSTCPSAAETDSNWIFFTRTLKPLTETQASQKMAWQFTTAQLLWLSQFISQVTMEMYNADSLSFTPVPPLLTPPLKKRKKKIATTAKLAWYALTDHNLLHKLQKPHSIKLLTETWLKQKYLCSDLPPHVFMLRS